MRIDFNNKSYLVVGGARGIGAEVCRQIALAGGNVAWTHLGNEADREGTSVLQAELKKLGVDCMAKAVDCADNLETARFCAEIIANWKNISGLVFCAGFTTPKPFLEISPDEWRKLVEINLSGAFYAAQEVIPHFKESKNGAIVLIGSAAVATGGGGRADYVSAKSGLEGLSRAITKEFAPSGIRCNIVHPSLIDTDLLRQRHPDPDKRKYLAAEVPLRRLGRPEDIAHATVFLLSDCASYITGQSLYVDGGRTFCR